jgi:hypothetical protein
MIKFTCQSPYDRANKIRQGMDLLSYRTNEYFKQFGLTIGSDMIVVIFFIFIYI